MDTIIREEEYDQLVWLQEFFSVALTHTGRLTNLLGTKTDIQAQLRWPNEPFWARLTFALKF